MSCLLRAATAWRFGFFQLPIHARPSVRSVRQPGVINLELEGYQIDPATPPVLERAFTVTASLDSADATRMGHIVDP